MRSFRPVAAVAALVASLAWLHTLGHHELAPAPWTNPAALADWADERGAVAAAFAVLRQVTLVLGWYLLLTLVIGWIVRVLELRHAQRALDTITLPSVRRLLGRVAGAGLASAVALAAPAGASPPTPGVAVIHHLDAETPETAPTTIAPSPPEAPATSAGTASIHRVEQPEPAPPTVDDTWTVAPGDCFWHVASSHLLAVTGVEPDDAAVTRYWLTLIEANRAGLPDPQNPDLLFASMELVLPPV